MFRFQKFTVKDIIFLAIMAAAMTVVGMISVPFVLSIQVFGIRTLVSAIFMSMIGAIVLMKVRKPGALFISCTLYGLVLLMMSPVMFLMMVTSSLLAEVVALLIHRSYEKDKAICLAATLVPVFSLPMSIVFNMALLGVSASEMYFFSPVTIAVIVGTIALSVLGAWIGWLIGKELRKAGKIA